MKKNTISLATAITAAFISSAAQADSWNVTQTTTPASDTTITQYGSAQGSAIQSMNAVNSTTATVTGSQAVASGAFELELEQKEQTSDSTQSVNYLKAETIGTLGSSMKQDYSSSGNTLMKQNEANLVNNHQAVNTASAATISELSQAANASNLNLDQASASASSQVMNSAVATNVSDLTQSAQSDYTHSYQSGATEGSIQATNNLTAEKASNVKQSTQTSSFALHQSGGGNNTQTVNNIAVHTALEQANQSTSADYFHLDQHGSGNQIQAVNRVSSGTSAVGSVNQSTSGHSDMWQMGWTSQDSTQALNMIDGKGVGIASKQTVSGSGVHMHSDGGGTQAGNYLKSSGDGVVASADQDVNADHVDIKQHSYGAATVQAANLMDIGGELSAGKQTINTNSLYLHQYASDSGLNAGNAVLTSSAGIGGTVTQAASATTLSMHQYSGNGAIQAVNYVGNAPQ